MIKKPRPICVYTGKECPEKPFTERQDYPDGIITGYNKKGCNRWIIDKIWDIKTHEIKITGKCLDEWNYFHLRQYGVAAFGNQKATEQLRNGLCEELIKKDKEGKEYSVYVPKINPHIFHALKENTNAIAYAVEQIGVMALEENKIQLLEQKESIEDG